MVVHNSLYQQSDKHFYLHFTYINWILVRGWKDRLVLFDELFGH